MIRLGTVFRGKYGEYHYWFVISDPKINGHEIVCVNMTSFHGYRQEDLSCELMPGDHEVVDHHSWVYYGMAKIYQKKILERWLQTSTIEIIPPPCSVDLLHKLHSGAFASHSVPDKVIDILKSQGFDSASIKE